MIHTPTQQGAALFIPHGGGPMPLLGDKSHQDLIAFLNNIEHLIKKAASYFNNQCSLGRKSRHSHQ